MRTTKHAPRGPCHFLEHPHALADIVQRGAVSAVERLSVQLFKCEDDLLEAEAKLDELLQRPLRVNGENHPHTAELQKSLDRSKVMLRLFRARAARAASRAAETKSEPPEDS